MNVFWENEYLNTEKFVFGDPSPEVIDIVPLLPKSAKILDVGCGDGRHSLYLADLGFEVDAFDISQNAIKKIDYLKEKNNLIINTQVCDVSDFEFTYEYDLIIIHGVLQYISKNKQSEIIELLKKWTKKTGYHILTVFTDEEPIPIDLQEIMVGVFKKEEIKNYYLDWEIVMFESRKFTDEHENGIKHCHASNKLVAKKVL